MFQIFFLTDLEIWLVRLDLVTVIMLSGLSSYLFGTPAEEDHPAAATESAAALAEAAKTHRFRTKSAEYDWTIVDRSSRKSAVLTFLF